ncbi:MAG: terminase large subunit domain-containing protein, partial [Myxococcales bacterium]
MLQQALTPKVTKYFRHSPTDRQRAFLLYNGREALYGGAAGGGKSDALLMAALQYADVPGYSAVLFRRTYADLAKPEALMDRANEWLRGADAKWNEQRKQWRFPSGAVLSFGHLEHENDKYEYQGAAYQFIGFDELTQFTRTQYLYLFSRLRRLKGLPVPLRVRAGSNPGGVGHEWVFDRFFTNRGSRVFVRSLLED